MALVDYSSSSSNSEDSETENGQLRVADTKHRSSNPSNLAGAQSVTGLVAARIGSGPESKLPPLPPAFHDLYASTVRQSAVDDPALHQGRKRQVPHIVGNWPSHLYVEWRPDPDQHRLLQRLLSQVRENLSGGVTLHDFLTSDLGSPLPLHISLSRPISLSTSNKDGFLDKISAAIRGCGVRRFAVTPNDLFWYTSPDSNRTFLILRVASKSESDSDGTVSHNHELLTLLTTCNEVATSFNLPTLYQLDSTEAARDSFHISIGWTFDFSADGRFLDVLKVFASDQFREIQSWMIDIAAIKAKIGNVITSIPLRGTKRIGGFSGVASTSLFGM